MREETAPQYALGRGEGAEMSEEITQQEENENQPAGGSQTFTQEQVNQLVGAARKKERAKYEGFDQYKAAFEKLQEIEEKDKTDLEKALARAEKAEQELTARQEAERIAKDKAEVSESSGVPVEALNGSTREEIEASAEVLAKYFKQDSGYVASDGFAPTDGTKQTPKQQFLGAIENLF